MNPGGNRLNGVKEKERRLRMMQIELGRARLVSRPLDQVLQQPVSIVPLSDPDGDGDNVSANTDPPLHSQAVRVSSMEDKCVESRVIDRKNLISSSAEVELLEEPDSTPAKRHSTNPFHSSFAYDDPQLQPTRNSNPFTDAPKPELSSSSSLTDAQRGDFPCSNPFTGTCSSDDSPCVNPFTDAHKSDFSAGGVADASDDDLKGGFLNSLSLVPPTQTSLEETEDSPESFSDMYVSNVLSPISEENSSLSMLSDMENARKDSGYCVTGLESLSSATSPQYEGNHLFWEQGSAITSDPASDSGGGALVSSAQNDNGGTEDSVQFAPRSSNSSRTVKASEEELVYFTNKEPSERDSSQQVGSVTDREASEREGGSQLGKDDHHQHQPESVLEKNAWSAEFRLKDMQQSTCSSRSLPSMSSENSVTQGDMTGDENTYVAFSDIDSDFVSSPSGLDVEDEASDATISETDGEFQSNAVGLLVEVYGMDKDELSEGNLSEIPEESPTDLDATSGSEKSDSSLPPGAGSFCEKMASKKLLKKEPNIDVTNLDDRDPLTEGESDKGNVQSPDTDSATCSPSCGSPSVAGMEQTPAVHDRTVAVSGDSQQESASAPPVDHVQSILFINNLEFSVPRLNSQTGDEQGEGDISLPGDVSDYSLTTCYDSLDPSFDMDDRSSEIRPEIFEAFASEIISNLMEGSFSLSSMPSMNYEGCATPTQSLSSFEKNEVDCRSPALTPDPEDTLSLPSEDEETQQKESAAERTDAEQMTAGKSHQVACMTRTNLDKHSDLKMDEIVCDRLSENSESCKDKEGVELGTVVATSQPGVMSFVQDRRIGAEENESDQDADSEESIDVCEEQPVRMARARKVRSRMGVAVCDTDIRKEREQQISVTPPVSINPSLPDTHHHTSPVGKSNAVVFQRNSHSSDSVSAVDANKCRGNESHDIAQTVSATDCFTFPGNRHSQHLDVSGGSEQDLYHLQESALENYITPNIQIRSAQNKMHSGVAGGASDVADETNFSECRNQDDDDIDVTDAEYRHGQLQDADTKIASVVMSGTSKGGKGSDSEDFTTLPQSPILMCAPYDSSSAGPNTAPAEYSSSFPETASASSSSDEADISDRFPDATHGISAYGHSTVCEDKPCVGESNMSYLLNKWQRMEEASGLSPSIQEPDGMSGFKSSRYLSTSTPDFGSIPALQAQDLHRTAGSIISPEDTENTLNPSTTTTMHVLSQESDPVIYCSTGDLQTSGRASGKPDLQPVSDSTLAVPKGDGYLMSSIENLNIVLITSNDTERCGDGALRQQSAGVSGGAALATSSSAQQEKPSPGLQEVKETVAGLPSVMSLIAKFSHQANKSSAESAPTSFATSRKRWSSAPRLQDSESSALESSSGKRSSSVHYRWDPSASSWVSSSPASGRPRYVSSRSSQEEQMRQDERAELQSREEEEAEVKRRSYQETKTEEETVDTAAVGGLEQKEEDGLEEKQVTREQTPQKEDEMSSVKNQFEQQQQQQAPPKETAQQRQEASSAPQQSKPSTTLEGQWEDEPEEGVYENEPEQRADVVRETDRDIGAELPSVGTAKSMRDKFVSGKMENTPAEVKKEVTPPPAASNGGVFENEPKFNPDVIHAGDENQEVMPEQGTARNLAARFKEMEKEGAVPVPSRGKREITPDKTGKVEYVSEPRGHVEKYEPEVQAGIFESQPSERADVVKADELPEEILPEKGAAKNLAQRFKQMSTENTNTSTPRAKREITPDTSGRVEYVSEPTGFVEKYEGRTESGVFESQPADREGVVKSDSAPEDILPEQGTTRNIAARFKEMEKTTKSPPSPSKVKEFTPPRENGPASQSSGVYESSPQVASDVVHADDQVEEVMPEKGTAKSIANRFRQLSSGDPTPAKSPRSKKEFTPPPGGSGVYENTPKQFVPDYNKPAESGILESKPESRSDVVRSEDPIPSSEQELPEQGYTKNLLSAWRQKESSASSAKASPPSSGKPKEFTPPREEPRVAQQRPAPRTPKSPLAGTDMNDGSVHPSDLPGQYQPQAEASVYESEPERREDVVREEDTDWQQGMPKPDTTKKMLAKFKHIQQQATSPTADTTPTKPKPTARKEGEESSADKVGRSKSMRVPVQLEKCGACQKTVYVMEKIEIEKHSYHKSCFRCSHCHCVLTPKTFAINNNVMFCTTHYKQLFATRGNYDEGFGRDQHKKRWKSEPNLADDELSSTGSAQH